MRKPVVKIWDLPSSGAAAALVILSAAFLLGGAAACLLAGRVVDDGSGALGGYLEGYLSALQSGGAAKPEMLSLIWEIARWPLFTVVLGLTPLGLLGVPVLFLIRGFLLSFSIAAFFRVLGGMGLALAFAVFGVTGLLAVPVLFVLGVQGVLSAAAMTGRLLDESRRSTGIDRMYLLRCGICAGVLCVCGCLEYNVVPAVLEWLAVTLFA